MNVMPSSKRTTPRTSRIITMALASAMLVVSGCQSERRVISVKGGLAGIRGAEGQELAESQRIDRPRGSAFGDLASEQRRQAIGEQPTDGEAAPLNPNTLRIAHDDGGFTLIMSSPRHVVAHLRQTLVQDEPELLFEQVLSNQSKSIYAAQGKDPHEAVEFLFSNRREVLKMLQRMPQGEFTPGMFLKKIGPSAYRLELSGANGQGLRLTRLDVVWEQGVCRLLSVS